MIALTSLGIPNFSSLVKRTGHNFVSKWIIKRHTIYYIAVLIETEKFLTCVSIPNFARTIVATSDKCHQIC